MTHPRTAPHLTSVRLGKVTPLAAVYRNYSKIMLYFELMEPTYRIYAVQRATPLEVDLRHFSRVWHSNNVPRTKRTCFRCLLLAGFSVATQARSIGSRRAVYEDYHRASSHQK